VKGISALAGLTLLIGACGDDRRAPLGACDGHGCSEACVSLAGGDCNTLDQACRERIFAAVRCVYGSNGEPPFIRVLTEDEVRTEAEANADDADAHDADAGADPGVPDDDATDVDGGADAGVPDDEIARAQTWDTAWRLLGLRLPVTTTQDVTSYVGGYYEPLEQRITLVDRGEGGASVRAQRVLAHELLHALQDQQVGLSEIERRTSRTTDAQLARGCLVEGEAVLYEDLAWSLLRGLSVDPATWELDQAANLKYTRDTVAASDAPVDQLWQLRYAVGAQWLADLYRREGTRAVQALYDAPPSTTAFWMLGGNEEGPPLSSPLACDDAAHPSAFERVGSDSLGAFGLFAFLAHNLAEDGVYPTELSWQRALTWRQDRIEIFRDLDGVTALSWRIAFETQRAADDVATALESAALGLRIQKANREIEIVAADDMHVLSRWEHTRASDCPALE
jgi:hypothetical protein